MHDASQQHERRTVLLARIVDRMAWPMAVLGLVWLVLLIVDLVRGLPPVLAWISAAIWIVFIFEFLLELLVAPRKLAYLRQNWLTGLALVVPALRVFRLLQLVRVLQGARLVRIVSSITRGMHALGTSLGRHGFRYVVALTLVVTLAGAAGMYAFERDAPGSALRSYPEALWWTAMIMATIGSGYWPLTSEGRVLCLFLALYAFSVFGYVTAALATFLVGREAQQPESELPGARNLDGLRREIASLRDEVRALGERWPKDGA